MPPRNIIFLHIPKAAGSTLIRILRRQYPPEQRHTISTSPSVQMSIEAFRNKPEAERRGIRCVMGHGTFGLHNALVGPTQYIALLRDPVERIISHYYYVRRYTGHRLHDRLHAEGWSLHEYVSDSSNRELENGMVRCMTGATGGRITEADLDQALHNLDAYFAVSGTVQRFDASLLLMKQRLGWSSVYYRKRNVTSDRPTKSNIPVHTLRLIRSKNRYDLQLYRHVRSTLEYELEQTDLRGQHRILNLQCAAYKAYQTLRATARSFWASLPVG
ncbi:hypothetical protein GGP79_002338 [Salinibacter ruber]|uniref:sulfotransferase family protein n=1 Tax=Salinibacter ruber TaxID=146919 RepID=UPI00216A7820|nr:hypothetical protein [Salinibacter ruber]